jgi:hypothetical protein
MVDVFIGFNLSEFEFSIFELWFNGQMIGWSGEKGGGGERTDRWMDR